VTTLKHKSYGATFAPSPESIRKSVKRKRYITGLEVSNNEGLFTPCNRFTSDIEVTDVPKTVGFYRRCSQRQEVWAQVGGGFIKE